MFLQNVAMYPVVNTSKIEPGPIVSIDQKFDPWIPQSIAVNINANIVNELSQIFCHLV